MASKVRKPKAAPGRIGKGAAAPKARKAGTRRRSDGSPASEAGAELERAKRRIAELERERERILEQIDLAIETINKILKTQN